MIFSRSNIILTRTANRLTGGAGKYRFMMILIIIILVLDSPGSVEAAGIKVAPGRFIINDVNPGNLYNIREETGQRLSVFNDDSSTRTWSLSTHRPSERGQWETGYSEIPDPAWCWFEKSEITVPPQGVAYVQLFLKIPDLEKYYNQHWAVTLAVTEKNQKGIALAVDIRALIETKPKYKIYSGTEGRFGPVPGVVDLLFWNSGFKMENHLTHSWKDNKLAFNYVSREKLILIRKRENVGLFEYERISRR